MPPFLRTHRWLGCASKSPGQRRHRLGGFDLPDRLQRRRAGHSHGDPRQVFTPSFTLLGHWAGPADDEAAVEAQRGRVVVPLDAA